MDGKSVHVWTHLTRAFPRFAKTKLVQTDNMLSLKPGCEICDRGVETLRLHHLLPVDSHLVDVLRTKIWQGCRVMINAVIKAIQYSSHAAEHVGDT